MTDDGVVNPSPARSGSGFPWPPPHSGPRRSSTRNGSDTATVRVNSCGHWMILPRWDVYAAMRSNPSWCLLFAIPSALPGPLWIVPAPAQACRTAGSLLEGSLKNWDLLSCSMRTFVRNKWLLHPPFLHQNIFQWFSLSPRTKTKQPVTTIDSFEGPPGKARTTIASPNQPGKAHLQGSQQQTNPARAAGWLDGMMGIHKSSSIQYWTFNFGGLPDLFAVYASHFRWKNGVTSCSSFVSQRATESSNSTLKRRVAMWRVKPRRCETFSLEPFGATVVGWVLSTE